MSHADSPLVSRARRGDVEAFEQLTREHQQRLYRFILAVAGNPEDAEDALQETLLCAYRALPQFRGEASFTTWLYRIALNATRNWLRSQARRSAERMSERMVGATPGPASNVEEAFFERQRIETARQALLALPDHYRDALLLRHYEDMSYEQIAQVTSVPVGTVRSRIAEGRRLLLKRLSAAGFAPG